MFILYVHALDVKQPYCISLPRDEVCNESNICVDSNIELIETNLELNKDFESRHSYIEPDCDVGNYFEGIVRNSS